MGRKIGRNELCPCGSGKKYKRGGKGDAEKISGMDRGEKTGAIIDECLDIFERLTVFSAELIQFDKEGEILKRVWDNFESNFDHAEDPSAPAILFMNWLNLDYCFGQTLETVCERFIEAIEKRKKLIVSQTGGVAISEEEILKRAYKKMVGMWCSMPGQAMAEA